MKYLKTVYYIKDQNRLVIINEKVSNSNYLELFSSEGEDEKIVYQFCKYFCGGYIIGSTTKKEPVNNLNEFQ
jgi:hypothetical protein